MAQLTIFDGQFFNINVLLQHRISMVDTYSSTKYIYTTPLGNQVVITGSDFTYDNDDPSHVTGGIPSTFEIYNIDGDIAGRVTNFDMSLGAFVFMAGTAVLSRTLFMGDDTMTGSSGDDTFPGETAGHNMIDGGAGFDYIELGSTTDTYIYRTENNTYEVYARTSGRTDLVNIEAIRFTDSPGIIYQLDANSPDFSNALLRFSADFNGQAAQSAFVTGGGYGDAVISNGTDNIYSDDGTSFALLTATEYGPFSRLGGYRLDLSGGIQTTMRVYLNPSWESGEGFDVSLAANGKDGQHRRDFVFHVAKDASTNQLLIGAGNNTDFSVPQDLEDGSHGVVGSFGWHNFVWNMYQGSDGALEVAMSVYDRSDRYIFTKVISDPSDTIDSLVGGNRYLWFTNIDVAGGIGVDDIALSTVDTNPVQLVLGEGDQLSADGSTILTTYATIKDAVDNAHSGNVVDLASGDYSSDVPVLVVVEGLTFRGPADATGVDLVLGDGVTALELAGGAPVDVTGNATDNILMGNAGANTLDGGHGADIMTGGLGNDIYFVDDSGDAVIEMPGEGADTVMASTSYTLLADLENLTLVGADNLNGTGNDQRNMIFGNDGDNVLAGLGGDDDVSGGLGSDVIDGGSGSGDGSFLRGLNGGGFDLIKVGSTVYALDEADRSFDTITNVEYLLEFGYNGQPYGQVLVAQIVEIFDPLKYAASYTDLAQTFRLDAGGELAHYLTTGFFEGREVSFDAGQYLANFDDLQSAFGSDVAAATQHFLTTGVDEHRLAEDPLDYIASYSDLIGAFGGNSQARLEALGLYHYIASGFDEGRRPGIDFDPGQYLTNYLDLQSAFGTDDDAAAVHFISAGYSEHRLWENPLDYIASYGDLISAFAGETAAQLRQSGLDHFQSGGFDEGREPGIDFDVNHYLANYVDLRAAFADGNGGYLEDAATLHFIQSGYAEGRTDDLMIL